MYRHAAWYMTLKPTAVPIPVCPSQVDKPWEEVYKSLPEPLYRHQYGT